MPQHRSTRTIKRRRRKIQQPRTRKVNRKIQSIIFSKKYFTKNKIIKWLNKLGYKDNKIHVTKNFYRARQFPPKRGKKYITLISSTGLRFIIQI
jgi:hypothetical protein